MLVLDQDVYLCRFPVKTRIFQQAQQPGSVEITISMLAPAYQTAAQAIFPSKILVGTLGNKLTNC